MCWREFRQGGPACSLPLQAWGPVPSRAAHEGRWAGLQRAPPGLQSLKPQLCACLSVGRACSCTCSTEARDPLSHLASVQVCQLITCHLPHCSGSGRAPEVGPLPPRPSRKQLTFPGFPEGGDWGTSRPLDPRGHRPQICGAWGQRVDVQGARASPGAGGAASGVF